MIPFSTATALSVGSQSDSSTKITVLYSCNSYITLSPHLPGLNVPVEYGTSLLPVGRAGRQGDCY